jgi:hypothetical protein
MAFDIQAFFHFFLVKSVTLTFEGLDAEGTGLVLIAVETEVVR